MGTETKNVNEPAATVRETMEKLKETGSRRRLRLWLPVFGLLALAAGTAMAVSSSLSGNGTTYDTRELRRGDLRITVSATGNLAATNQVEVGSELSGIVASVKADYNTQVVPNQPLAALDDTKFQAAVLKSRAELTAAKAKFREARAGRQAAERILRRYRQTHELTQGKMPALEELEQAETEVEVAIAAEESAAAGVEVAEAALRLNEADLRKTVIMSPINGVVLSRNVEPGQTVAASLQSPVLFTLAEDLKTMELLVDIDEADVGQVAEGQPATFTVDAYPGKTFHATITQVRFGADTTDGGVVTYKAALAVANADLLLRPGMTATADIVVQRVDDALLVPNSAFLYAPAPRQKVEKPKRNLFSALLSGPRHRNARPSGGDAAAGAGQSPDEGRIWILDQQRRPQAVEVRRISSDGAVTAVRSSDLREGMQVITNEVQAAK